MNAKCADGSRVVVKTAGSRSSMSCSCGASATGNPAQVQATATQRIRMHNR